MRVRRHASWFVRADAASEAQSERGGLAGSPPGGDTTSYAYERKAESEEFHFKSFMIELVFAHLADEGLDCSDYRASLEQFFVYIVSTGFKQRVAFEDFYDPRTVQVDPSPIQIIDPVNPKNNVACRYTEADRQRIVAAASNALDAINEAHMTETVALAYEMWQIVLGPSFRR